MTETLDRFLALFSCRTDIYGDGYPNKKKKNKYNYANVKEPFTRDVLQSHLKGLRQIGVYPADAETNTVWWFAVDCDAPKGFEGDPFPVALSEARAYQVTLKNAGVTTYVERSRSGGGVHVWGFLSEPVEASTVLRAIKPLLPKELTLDRIYPVQQDVRKGKGMGNLIALPYNGVAVKFGNSMFLDDNDQPITLDEFISSVEVNDAARIVELSSKHKPLTTLTPAASFDGDPFGSDDYSSNYSGGGGGDEFAGRPEQPITGVLKLISEYGCRFMNHAWVNRHTLKENEWWVALAQLTAFQNGRSAAHLISRDYEGYSEDETDQKFDNLMQNPPHGCAYIKQHFPELACKSCPMKAPYHQADKKILELVQESSAPMRKVSVKKHLDKVRKRNTGEEVSGVSCGLPLLENHVKFRNSELSVIGAMPSIGKTALMIDAALNIARAGVPALVFSAETAESGLFDRILAHEAGIDSLALRGERRDPTTGNLLPLSDHEWQVIEAATDGIDELPLFVNFTDINPEQVLRNIERVLLENRIPFDAPYVVFFDYLQFGAKLDSETNYERVSRLSTEFKNIAKITNHPVVIFSQLIRSAEGAEEPAITWFKESGRIEQDADVAMILTGERVQGKRAPRRVTVVKQREGESQVKVDFILEQDVCRFRARAAAGTNQDKPDLLSDDRPELFGSTT